MRYHSQTAATRSRILGRRSIVQEASTKLSVPEDERMMLLAASRRSDSLGDFDLYVSQKQPAGKWGEPVNLGPEINTAARELSPKLAPNGKYLVWMSCRLPALSPKPQTRTTAQVLQELHAPGNGVGDIYQIDISALSALRQP